MDETEELQVADAMLGIIADLIRDLPETAPGPDDPSRIQSREEVRRHFEEHEVWQDEDRRQRIMSKLGLWGRED